MNTFDLTLDLSKQVSMEPLRLRQGDKSGTTVRATVYDHGELVSGSYTARIAMRHPGSGATYYRETGTFSNGVATFTIDEQYAATVTGRTTGYVQLLQGSTVIASTADFPVVILRDATEGAVPGEVYDSAIEDALAELDEATGRISVMVQEQVAEELAAHPEWTTTVIDGSVTDAKLVQTGGILSRVDRLMYRLDNLLTGDTGEQEVAVVADAAATPVAGLSVYGRSVQDGTPTPSAPVAIQSVEGNLLPNNGSSQTNNGITFTVNADGSVTCRGTSTSSGTTHFNIVNGRGTDKLRLPDGIYTLRAWQDGTGVSYTYLSLMKDGVYVAQDVLRVTGSNGCSVAAIEGYDYDAIHVGFLITGGTTVNATIRFALFAGDQSMCGGYIPYGHAGLWARGKNLLDIPGWWSTTTLNGITCTVNADGSVALSGTATASSDVISYSISAGVPIAPLEPGSYVLTGCPANGSTNTYYLVLRGVRADGTTKFYPGDTGSGVTFTLAEGEVIDRVYINVKDGVNMDGKVFRPMLRRAETGAGFVPYVESVTPVPLGGHVLRSLPDGTRDEVTVDERGHAVLTQRVGEVTLDGSESWSAASVSGVFNLVLWRQSEGTLIPASQQSGLCDRLTWDGSNVAGMADGTFKVGSSGTSEYAFIVNKSLATAAEIKAWLAENPTTITYKLATPATHDLGYVDPVALTSPDATMQAVTGIATTFRADYERDLNVTLARLEAAIATLA